MPQAFHHGDTTMSLVLCTWKGEGHDGKTAVVCDVVGRTKSDLLATFFSLENLV